MDKENLDNYSILSELLNNLEDDLQLDLGKGENGYASYEESYKAVKRYTLRLLKKHCKRLQKKRFASVSGEEQ